MRRRLAVAARLVAAVGILAGTSLAVGAGPGLVQEASASTTVNGTGSTFAALELQQWESDVKKAPYNLSINYTVSSSGAGRQDYAAGGQYDFAASDIVYNAEDGAPYQQIQAGTFKYPFKYVTVSAGGLAFDYNLVIGGEEFDDLNLTPADVCGIFTGEITNWTQVATGTTFENITIPPTNGDNILASFNQSIIPIVRSDSAGESYVLSQYCQATEPAEWSAFQTWVDQNAGNISYSDPNMANGLPVSLWPGTLINGDNTVQSASGATAASTAVKNTGNNGAITYVAAAYAKIDNSPVASVENGGGYFVQPTPNNVQIALSYAQANSLGTFNLNFSGTNPSAYFPSTYSYVIDPTTTNTPDAGINGPLNQYLCYSIGAGQQEAGTLLYAPLSQAVTKLSVAAVESTLDAPPSSQCGIGGPQPVVSANGGGVSGNSGGSGTSTGHPARAPVKSSTPPPTVSTGTGSSGTGSSGTGSSGGSTGSGAGSSGTGSGVGGGSPTATVPGGTSTGSSGSTGSGSSCSTGHTVTTKGGPRRRHGSTTPTTACTSSTLPGATVAPGSDVSPSGGSASGGAPAVQSVTQAANASASSAIGDQALWWVLGGAVLAAGVAWLVGLTKKSAS